MYITAKQFRGKITFSLRHFFHTYLKVENDLFGQRMTTVVKLAIKMKWSNRLSERSSSSEIAFQMYAEQNRKMAK